MQVSSDKIIVHGSEAMGKSNCGISKLGAWRKKGVSSPCKVELKGNQE